MQAADELQTIADLAVALVGFSGLIFIFRARSIKEMEERDLSALAMIVGAGTLALVFALLPLPLFYTGIAEAALWRLSSAVFAATIVLSAGAFIRVNARLAAAGHAERAPGLNRTALVLMLLMAILLLLTALGFFAAGPAAYLLALIACLLMCLSYVAFMLVVARRSGSS